MTNTLLMLVIVPMAIALFVYGCITLKAALQVIASQKVMRGPRHKSFLEMDSQSLLTLGEEQQTGTTTQESATIQTSRKLRTKIMTCKNMTLVSMEKHIGKIDKEYRGVLKCTFKNSYRTLYYYFLHQSYPGITCARYMALARFFGHGKPHIFRIMSEEEMQKRYVGKKFNVKWREEAFHEEPHGIRPQVVSFSPIK